MTRDTKSEPAGLNPVESEAAAPPGEALPADPAKSLPRNPGGIASGLQPGGTIPGKTPAAGTGAIGTGGGSTADKATGSVKRTL